VVKLLLLVLLGCQNSVAPSPPRFVAGGVIHSDPSLGGTPVAGSGSGSGRFYLEHDWQPGDHFSQTGVEWEAPEVADCAPIFHVELGNVRRHIAQGGAAPDTAMAWSPSGTMLAIGTFLGEVLVVDGWSGTILKRRQFAETMVKQIAWSANGETLYVAEQSPSGTVSALDPTTLRSKWSLHLADFVGQSPLPPGDLYGVYTLPAAYSMDVLPNGSLFIVATHAWNNASGVRLNQTQLLQVSPQGEVEQRWPEQAADAVMYRAFVSGMNAVIPISKSSPGLPPVDFPVGGALVFDLSAFGATVAIKPSPLKPWFTNTFLWEAVDIDGQHVMLGFGDGRVGLWSMDGTQSVAFPSGTPIQAGPVPIVASVGSGFLHGDRAVYQTSWTHIPFGAAAPELRPPAAHPRANSIFVAGAQGEVLWSWSGPHVLEGISLGADGRTLIVGASTRVNDTRRDLFGALLFDLGPSEQPQAPQLSRFCATEGPVFFRASSTADGRIALAEHPHQQGDEPAFGAYQVTVFR